MKTYSDLKTGTKLSLTFGVMVLFLLAAIVIAWRGIAAIRDSQKKVLREDVAISIGIRSVRANDYAAAADSLELLLTTDPAARDVVLKDLKGREQSGDDAIRALMLMKDMDPQVRSGIERINGVRDVMRQVTDTQVVPLIVNGRLNEARALLTGPQKERNAQLRSLTVDLIALVEKMTQETVSRSLQRSDRSVLTFGLVGLAALVAGVLFAFSLSRIIANPLRSIAQVAERIADGDLTVELPTRRRADEVGFLQECFRTMVAKLRDVNGELQKGINLLGTTASEIVASTTQVATGATETATAVTQTTTTVEEVKQTALVASQKAKHVLDVAQRSVQISQTGTKSVEETIAGMNRIREQMETIAQSIVRLSEQSQAIGDIIATVGDLADQSNLLAVNAAIEAAKAGEQGRGFAVVAQEVRSLAEQSKQATAQVRSILGDVQKATTAAVMAAEQGTRVVDGGVKQSTGASEAIRQLSESITEAAQASTQIAASSQQQVVGMNQVAQAMESIKVASQQNAASTKQAEAAAQHLNDLGRRLKMLAEQYRV